MSTQLPSQYIICRDKLPTQVTVTHGSLNAAKAEAERLARKQNDRFMVFELIGVVAPAEPPLAWTWQQEAPIIQQQANFGNDAFRVELLIAIADRAVKEISQLQQQIIGMKAERTLHAAAQRDLLYPEDLGSDDLGDDWMGDIDPEDGEPFGAKG